jgi:hypothetical protein
MNNSITHAVIFLGTSLLFVQASLSADLYWDTDTSSPLVGSSSVLNFGGSYWSTAAAGNTALTTISADDNLFFQTDTIQAYTSYLDSAQSINDLNVGNGNIVTITTDDGSEITCSNQVSITGNSTLVFKHNANSKVLYGVNNTNLIPTINLGAGDNTFLIIGNGSSTAYQINGLSGDYGDKFGASNNSHWVYNRSGEDWTFGGELIGTLRLSPGKLTLTGDSQNFSGKLEAGAVTFGDGGTNGSISSSADFHLSTVKFNRSDDYVFTNTMTYNSQCYIHNLGGGTTTILSDGTGSQIRFYGDNGVFRGDMDFSQFLWNEGPGTWTLTGTNYFGGNSGFANSFYARNGGDWQIGDGSTFAKVTVRINADFASGSDLTMDLTGGAQMVVYTNLIAGTGRDLRIIGEGQVEPIITYGGTLTAFENVIYNGVTSTWAAAQVTDGLGGITQMRIVSGSIYIDPLEKGLLFMVR